MRRISSAVKDIYIRKLQETRAKKFLTAARRVISSELIRAHTNAIVNGQVISTIKGVNAGNLRSKMYDVPRRIQKQVSPVTKEYAEKIFAESQKRVPVDKKYIGRFNPEQSDTYTVVKREREYDVPIANTKTVNFTVYDMEDFHYSTKYKHKEFSIPKGVYIGDKKEFIDTYFKGSNKRKKYQLYIDDKDNLFHSYNARLYTGNGYGFGVEGLKPAIGTTSQDTGGNKELKKSGRIEEGTYGIYKYGYTISYDPTRQGTKWNYAQVQHDRLSYKHAVGESMFLYNSFEKYRKEYYDKVKKATGYVIKEFNDGR